MKKTQSLIILIALISTSQAYALMEEIHNVPRGKQVLSEEEQGDQPVVVDQNKLFYTNLLKKLQAQNPKASKEELLRIAEPMWYKHLELEKNKPKKRPSLSNELDIKENN